METIVRNLGWLCLLATLLAITSAAQNKPQAVKPTADASDEDLQKATQNPVASPITVPIQNNTNFNIGSFDRTQNVINIQPVIPSKLGENWMLITRIIQPIDGHQHDSGSREIEHGAFGGRAGAAQKWMLGVLVNRIRRVGAQPVNLSLQFYANPIRHRSRIWTRYRLWASGLCLIGATI
jgi:hypothetical protein